MSTRLELERRSFLSGANAAFIAELNRRYLENPAGVDPSWIAFFAEMRDDRIHVEAELRGASWAPRQEPPPAAARIAAGNGSQGAAAAGVADLVEAAARDTLRAFALIRACRARGHLAARLDPLGLDRRVAPVELDYRTYGFTDADLDRAIFIDRVLGTGTATLRDIVDRLRASYCGTIGVEYLHIQDPAQQLWLQQQIEHAGAETAIADDDRRMILLGLTEAEMFERYLDRKFVGAKRYGLEGGDSLVPALREVIAQAARAGAKEVVLGMPHRGRLNVLANVVGKALPAIFAEFKADGAHAAGVPGSGDVKYHLGFSSDREVAGNLLHLSLVANPSHLEVVNPVVLGKARAKQRLRGDRARELVIPVLVHGDAAFAGQGIVAETLEFCDLTGYRVGGTIHLIVNNQVGFTTDPGNARTGLYCSAPARIVEAPVFHVNGDDPEAVVRVARLAVAFRRRFKRDVVIDIVCYRRHGHSEVDEPAYTQPLMYQAIARHPTTRQIYAERLERAGVVTRAEIERLDADVLARLDRGFGAAAAAGDAKADWLGGAWSGFTNAVDDADPGPSAVDLGRLREIGLGLVRHPADFAVNRKLARILEQRRKTIETGEGIDWATAEALAFGSLLVEGTPVRFSGQDSVRGAFSQRHLTLIDQATEARFTPLAELSPDQAKFEAIDSPLAEASVLGFEYGYSLADPRTLVLWEAQFGDFANGAQAIVDEFVSAGASKWLRLSGLVMLLPHGYEGQGPDHSSARVERYLQLCAEGNMQVVNCTTPAQYFHVLRRQMKRNFRRPLIVMTPKSLLRHRRCVSSLGDFGPGTGFRPVVHAVPSTPAQGAIRRVVLCSGKIYYDLSEALERRGLTDTHIVRLEQLYPFPTNALAAGLAPYGDVAFIWCQEESENMGAWNFVRPRIEQILDGLGAPRPRLRYVGRGESASPATGYYERYVEEQRKLVEDALSA